jgi:lipid-A-disaccharide synthase
MKYYIITGEASGDMHAANLMKELKRIDPGAVFRCWGGDLMRNEGGIIVKHYRDLAFMGFSEVIANLPAILGNLKMCKKDILNFHPDALILVDYPGFNLRIARFAHGAGYKVFYYISPQVWAWKKSRVYKIRKFVHRMFVILPFEKEFYARYGVKVDFVGHPLLDMIAGLSAGNEIEFRSSFRLGNKPVIALLPGSRKQEISKMLSLMLDIIPEFPQYRFVVAGAPSIEVDFYRSITGDREVVVVPGHTHALLQISYAALVTSGTATLETALFNVPEVVCYKGSFVSYQIAKRLVDRSVVKYISLVNLIMDREIVRELIQNDFTRENLIRELRAITENSEKRKKILTDYQRLREKLGAKGASKNTAESIYKETTHFFEKRY